MPFDVRLSAAVQKLGLKFDRTEFAQLPNGKKVGYPVSGTDYSLYYGIAADKLFVVGPVDIDVGIAWLTRSSKPLGQARFLVGSSLWVNDIFEVRAMGGVHVLGGDYDVRATLAASLEVLCPVSDRFSLSLAYSPSISGGQMLTMGVGLLSPRDLPKDKIRRDGIETALAQATQTLNEIKASLSEDVINEVARQYKEPAQMALRRIVALGNAVNYLVYPQYPWINPNGLGFSEWVAKAKGEVAFAKSLGPDSWSQDSISKLEQEVDNLPGEIAITLATDFAADKYGILKVLREMGAQNFDALTLYPERTKQRWATLKGHLGDFRHTVGNLGNVDTDPSIKNKIQSIVLPVLRKLDGLDAALSADIEGLDLSSARQVIVDAARQYPESDRDYAFEIMMTNYVNRATGENDVQTAQQVVVVYLQKVPLWLPGKVDELVSAYAPYSQQSDEKIRILELVSAEFQNGKGFTPDSVAKSVNQKMSKYGASTTDLPTSKYFPVNVVIKEHGSRLEFKWALSSSPKVDLGSEYNFNDVDSYINYVESHLQGVVLTDRHELMARRQHLILAMNAVQTAKIALEQLKDHRSVNFEMGRLDGLNEKIQNRIHNMETEIFDRLAKDLKRPFVDLDSIRKIRRDVYVLEKLLKNSDQILGALEIAERKIKGAKSL